MLNTLKKNNKFNRKIFDLDLSVRLKLKDAKYLSHSRYIYIQHISLPAIMSKTEGLIIFYREIDDTSLLEYYERKLTG